MKNLTKKIVFLTILTMVAGVLGGCGSKAPKEASNNDTENKKEAILVVAFGTSYADTREVTIDAAINQFKDTFKDYDVYSAFTSQTIINILKDRDNISVYNVKEAMDVLKEAKYEKVIVQPLHVMNGAEYDELSEVVNGYKDDFNELNIGKALLTTEEDFTNVIKALESQIKVEDGETVVFMGHGTHHKANEVYLKMQNYLHEAGHKNVFVGTVEGTPTFDDVVKCLDESGAKKVTLMPFMLVAGDHANNDMAGDEEDSWKTMLKELGYEVNTYVHGLGEVEDIRNIYIDHAKSVIDGK
jgi:sirohydrochlorin cobaltochelatase